MAGSTDRDTAAAGAAAGAGQGEGAAPQPATRSAPVDSVFGTEPEASGANDGSHTHPYHAANVFSKISFQWVAPVFAKGWKRGLSLDDMMPVPQEYNVHDRTDQLEAALRESGGKVSTAVWSNIRLSFALYTSLIFIQSAARLGGTQFLAALLAGFADPNADAGFLYGMAAGILGCAAIVVILNHIFFLIANSVGMSVRMGLMGVTFRKALRVRLGALSSVSVGNIVNIVTGDVERFQNLCMFVPFLVLGPIESGIVVYLMWREIGVASLAGLACVIGMVFVQGGMSKTWAKFRADTVKHSDQRVRLTSQVVSGMRVIKMYAWEPPFHRVVSAVRALESALVKRTANLRATTMAVAGAAPIIVGLLTFVAYYGLGQPMTPRAIFTTVSLLQVLQVTLGIYFPLGVQAWSESVIAARRMEKFLSLEEMPDRSSDGQTPDGVTATDMTARWDSAAAAAGGPADSTFELSHLTFRVEPGQLCGVVGSVGAGKSSLLLAILGELPAASGSVVAHGRIAYISQDPWIVSGTVRDNITFGRPFDQGLYDRVVHACALRTDFEQFSDGDMTVIGERGVNLSGGQKARIGLARGCYMNADVYLMDDPLSAVDARVARWLFEKAICGFLLGKTRILVTHQIQFLPGVDTVLVLNRGKLAGFGPYTELSERADLEADIRRPRTSSAVEPTSASRDRVESTTLMAPPVPQEDKPQQNNESGLVVAEKYAGGAIGFGVYAEYWRSSGNCLLRWLMTFVLVLGSCLYVSCNVYMSYWANMPFDKQQSVASVMIYVGLSLATLIVGVFRAISFFRMLINGSSGLHDSMFLHVLQAPILFFDSNPVGRILNRFSKDIGTMDEMLPWIAMDVVNAFLLCSIIAVLVCIINPWIFLALVPLIIVFGFLRTYYMKSGRDIKRLDSVSRSPVLAVLNECLTGLPTLRGYRIQPATLRRFGARLSDNARAYYTFIIASRWLGFRLDALCLIFLAAAAFGGVAVRSVLDAGLIGLTLTYTLNLTGLFQWMVRQSAELENQMVSVERVLEYTKIPTESMDLEYEIQRHPAADAPAVWPRTGALEFRNVRMAYRTGLPLVLKGVTCALPPGAKVGIVGRTGAGKSSILGALFRLVEYETDGSDVPGVYLDGVRTCGVELRKLRSSMSIIPQDPVLFSGSVRYNLDPFDEYSDEELWAALKQAQLDVYVRSLPDELNAQISESGSNVSVGQRQLFCLARALLRHSKVLVMDEATANVDMATDAIVQRAVRDAFKDSTVVMIAHRLATIIDADYVVVLDQGHVIEFGSPIELIEAEGPFFSMVQQTGVANARRLRHAAQHAAQARAAGTPTVTNAAALEAVTLAVEEDTQVAGDYGHAAPVAVVDEVDAPVASEQPAIPAQD